MFEGVRDRFGRLLELLILVQRPGEHIPGVNVPPDLQLSPGQNERLFQFQVVVSVEKRQIAVVDLLIELAQIGRELDQFILFPSFLLLADSLINVAQRSGIFWIWDGRDRFLVEFDGIGVSALRNTDFGKPSECTVVVGIFAKRRKVSSFSLAGFAGKEKFLAQLVLAPGNILGRHVDLHRRVRRTAASVE